MELERPLPHPITPEARPYWNGGGLSYTHSGMYGIFPIIEATRQLRGECGVRQVPEVRLSLVNGMGGMLSAAGTLILSDER